MFRIWYYYGMITASEKFFIALLAASLNETAAPSPQGVDAGVIYALATRHHLLGSIAVPLEKQSGAPQELRKLTRKAKYDSIRNDAVFMHELEAIEQAMEQAQVDMLTLKGPVIKALYPHSYLRSMSDLDILYHDSDERKVIEVMENLGYCCNGREAGNHLLFSKAPMTQVEFHPALLPRGTKHTYKDDDWAYTHPRSGHKHIFEMTPERYYEYMFLHLLQHLWAGGVGARFVMDVYVYSTVMAGKYDREKFQNDCRQMGIMTLVSNMESLAAAWFTGAELTKTQEELTQFILEGGLYGKTEHREASSVIRSGGSKLKHYWHIVFEPAAYIKELYPSLKRVPFLLPFYYFHRIPKRFFSRRNKAKARIQANKGLTREQIRRQQALFDKLEI